MGTIPGMNWSSPFATGYMLPKRTGSGGALVDEPGANQAIGQIGAAAFTQPGIFANALSNNYGAYAGGLASTAQAQANERSNWYGANAMAEAARQGAVGNMGSAALGAYGSAANSALGAWAANQQAYNKAASDMHAANQQGLSQYGQSRNNALGNLGAAYGGIGKAQVGANALANMNFSGSFGGSGDNGFTATGPSDTVASGSYGGGGGAGGFSFSGNRQSGSADLSGALGGLGSAQRNLMAGDITGGLNRNADAGRAQIDAQHYSSRMMPSQMLDQSLGGLLQLGRQGYGASSRGMNQYYGAMTDPRNRADFSGALTGLASGFGAANSNVNNLWDRSLGQTDFFTTPLQQAKRERDADLFNRNARARDQMASAMESQANGYGGYAAGVMANRLGYMPTY